MLYRRMLLFYALAWPALAAERPFFITYTHQMEEPGNLEVATRGVTANPGGAARFFGVTAELEYGVKAWWTTELYLDGVAVRHDSAVFTGYRWENRFRMLSREHWVNPALYVEFENINGADRSLLEVVGHDGRDDLIGTNDALRQERKREVEARLILSSNIRGWTVSENLITEKNSAMQLEWPARWHSPPGPGAATSAPRTSRQVWNSTVAWARTTRSDFGAPRITLPPRWLGRVRLA